jgi:hypothetical protein
LVRTTPKLCVAAARSLLVTAIDVARGGEIFVSCRRSGTQLRLEVRLHGPPFDAASRSSAFIRLSPRGHAPVAGELALGLGMLEHLCDVLGHSLHYASPAPSQQQLAIALSLAANGC